MHTRETVSIVFGGKSAEHEISLRSARSIVQALDSEKFQVQYIGITIEGIWLWGDRALVNFERLSLSDPKLKSYSRVCLIPGTDGGKLFNIDEAREIGDPGVLCIILHGPYGEDGTIQGLAKLYDIPFTGPGILGSAIGMDKDVTKRLLDQAGIPVAKWKTLTLQNRHECTWKSLTNALGNSLFVKPANLGSSVGITKATTEKEFEEALDLAFSFDSKVIVEECIIGREIECAVLGNQSPQASVPGEIIPHHDFYSYEAKYLDDEGATLKIPAPLDKHIVEQIRSLAVKAFQVLCAEGMARVDFFLSDQGQVYLNEINTIPGFTSISMYPKLWNAGGTTYSELLHTLLKLAKERFDLSHSLRSTR